MNQCKNDKETIQKNGIWQDYMQIMTCGNTKQMSSEFRSAAFPM